jgi:hypothetical protein
VILGPGGSAGNVYLSASTNGYTSAQATLKRASAAGPVKVNTLDEIEGEVEHATRSRTVDIDFTNYLQTRGVKPGRNTLRFSLSRFGRLPVERVLILPGSGVRATHLTPTRLVLSAPASVLRGTVGDTLELGYRLTNRGDTPARRVVYGLDRGASREELSSPRRLIRRVPALPGGGEIKGTFKVTAEAPGSYRLRLRAGSGNVGEIHSVTQDVLIASKPDEPSRLLPSLVGVALLSGGALLALRARARRR